jgi:hypothetical protein
VPRQATLLGRGSAVDASNTLAVVRLGVVADIHGNSVALEAVVADAEGFGVDGWWALGDLVLFGPRPVEALGMLAELPGIAYVSGNTDRYVLTGEQPAPHETPAHAVGELDLVERYAAMAGAIGWTRGALVQAGSLSVLSDLPPEQRIRLPDGLLLLGVHASPGHDDGQGIDSRVDAGDAEAVNDYAMVVTGSLLDPEGSGTPVAVAPAAAFWFGRGADLGPFVEDVGWSILQVDRFVEVVSTPDRATGTEVATVTVLAGDFDADELTAAMGDPDDGTWVAGSGTPGERSAGDATQARPIGESLWLSLPDANHLTVTGDAESSAAVTAVVAGDARGSRALADDSALAQVATALDSQGAYAAGLYRPGPGLAPSFAGGVLDEDGPACDAGLAERPDVVAVGIADEDRPVVLVVLVALAHGSGTAAEANADALERIVAEGASLSSGEPWSDSLQLDSIEVAGDNGTVALARLRPVEPRPRIWYDLLIQRENLISSC